ncbi:hypothetical protein [Duganella sp. Root336D2]|uniref:hypothetical protein n=1 Tax=Duganella sp. Root336D2 TaxID=1736518 RepID=UPI000700AB17|nr:hypothetical protein [Duganella sp. Root336D2]KQV61882.1 hypothetical protein ASD07_03400 [Duganella sp. Root336D2]
MTELFSVIRMAYAATLADAVASSAHAHVEPALRGDDGSLALDGEYDLPMRADLVSRGGSQAGKVLSVDSHTRMQFSVHTLPLPPAVVYVAPFVWDAVALRVGGLVPEQVGAVLAPWFMDWFDPEDANRPNEEGLFGVVHFASDPRAEGALVAFELDLGSAPVPALEDLLARLAAAGARDIRLA